MPRSVVQRYKNLFRTPLLIPNVVGDNRDPTHEPVLVAQTSMNAFGRMALLLQLAFVIFKDLIDDRNKRIQLGTHW